MNKSFVAPSTFVLAIGFAVACVPAPIDPASPVVRDPNAPVQPVDNTMMQPDDTKKPIDRPAVLTALTISPADPTLAVGDTVIFTAGGTYDDGTIADLTADVQWSVSDVALGAFETTPGVFRAIAEGSAMITATHPSASATTVVTLTPPVLQSLTLSTSATPPYVMGKGDTLQLSVVGTYGDGSEQTLTDVATYLASTTAVTVDASGLVTAVGLGPASVVASFEGMEASLDVNVQCSYPAGSPTTIRNGQMVPNLSWSKVYDASGNEVEFDLEAAHCGAPGFEGTKSIVFVIGAGWCPYCPDYMRNVNSRIDQIKAKGGMVVYVEMEDSSRRPAGGDYALEHINQIIGSGEGLRVGDADTNPSRAIGRASFVTSLPNQFVVRTSDMTVIDTGQTNMSTLLNLIDL